MLVATLVLSACSSIQSKPEPPPPPNGASQSSESSQEQQDTSAESASGGQQQSTEAAESQTESSAEQSSSSSPSGSPSEESEPSEDTQASSQSEASSQEQTESQTGSNDASTDETGGAETAAGGAESTDDLSEGNAQSTQGATGTTAGQGQTWQEQAGELDDQLTGSLAEFDGKLLTEKELLKAQRNAQQAEGGAPGLDAGEEEPEASSGLAGGEQDVTSEDSAPNQPPAGQGGNGRQPPSGNVPEDIPEGQDDDVVARQLREAAENEQDPVLREKLWQEYRDYKKGAGAS